MLLLNSESIFFRTSSICFLEKCSKEKCFSGDHWSGKKVIRPRSDESGAAFEPLAVFFYAHIVNQAPSGSASPSCSLSRFALARFFFLTRKTQHLSPSHRRVDVLKQLVKDFNAKSKLLLLCSLYVILRNCDLNEHAISFKFSERC